jgi:hypothetical protein
MTATPTPPAPLEPLRASIAVYSSKTVRFEVGDWLDTVQFPTPEIAAQVVAALPLGEPGKGMEERSPSVLTVEILETGAACNTRGASADAWRRVAHLAKCHLQELEPSASLRDAKRVEEPGDADLQPFGWAPGEYWAKCGECSKPHDFSDKRSSVCRPCAVKRFKAPETERSEVPKPKAEGSTPESSPMGVPPTLQEINQALRARLIVRIDENTALLAKVESLEAALRKIRDDERSLAAGLRLMAGKALGTWIIPGVEAGASQEGGAGA